MPSEIKLQAGRRLQAARIALGIEKQEAFAEILGVGATAYNNWENGVRMPDIAAMVRLFEKTGIGPDWIYAGSLRSVNYAIGDALRSAAEQVGALIGGQISEWPTVAGRRAAPNPTAQAPRRRLRHAPPSGPPPKGHPQD